MTQRTTWFRSCMECESTAPNRTGICPECEIEHGYVERPFVDDVDPASREPIPATYSNRMIWLHSNLVEG